MLYTVVCTVVGIEKKGASGAPEIKNTKYATNTQYRVFLYIFFRAQSAQQARKMGVSGAPASKIISYYLLNRRRCNRVH